jgi:hypothetical protein
MKIDTLKAKVLNHLKNGGKVFWVGHSEDPEPTWNNVQLYLQMFPWLFPYEKPVFGDIYYHSADSDLLQSVVERNDEGCKVGTEPTSQPKTTEAAGL